MFWIQEQLDQFGNWTVVQSGPVASLQISCQLDFETLCKDKGEGKDNGKDVWGWG